MLKFKCPKNSNEDRIKDIRKIVNRAWKDPKFTNAFVADALRKRKRTQQSIQNIPESKLILKGAYDRELAKPENEGNEVAISKRYEKKLKRCDDIKDKYSDYMVCLKTKDQMFLDKIKPKRALSGYMLYSQENRERIKECNPNATFGELGRLGGSEWKALNQEMKKAWNKRAADLYVSNKRTILGTSSTSSGR